MNPLGYQRQPLSEINTREISTPRSFTGSDKSPSLIRDIEAIAEACLTDENTPKSERNLDSHTISTPKIKPQNLESLTKGTSVLIEKSRLGEEVIATRMASGDLVLSSIGKKIASGSHGEVFNANLFPLHKRMQTLFNQTTENIAKFATDVVKKTVNADMIINECNLLHYLWEDENPGNLKGIQEPPHTLIAVDQPKMVGYLMKKYDGNGTALYKTGSRDGEGHLSLAECKFFGDQLFQGLIHLKHKQVAHFDLKPGNLLFKEKGESFEIVISDFGGSQRLDKPYAVYEAEKKEYNFKLPTFTLGFYCWEDYVNLHETCEEYSKKRSQLDKNQAPEKLDQELNEHLKSLFYAWDVRSMAITLLCLIAGKEMNEEQARNKFLEQLGSKYPQEMIDLFTQALDTNFKNRPSAEAFHTVFQKS